MSKRWVVAVAAFALVGLTACQKKDDENTEVTSDTAAIGSGDTVVTTTTTETETDTIRNDSTRADSTKH